MSGIDALLASLPAWTLIGGKGGVGKTTCAAALGTHSAQQGVPTLVLSTDPAGALADVLGTPLSDETLGVPSVPGLYACQLDAAAARTAFLDRWGPVLATIMDRGTYLDRDDIQGLIDATLPGVDETMALLALADIAQRGEWQRVFLDTAPTGHTLRLLSLPETFRAVVALLDSMQAKHRFMVSALMHRYRPDAADAFIGEMRAKLDRLHALLTDHARTGVVLVTRPEVVVAAETGRYAAALSSLHLSVRAVVVNAIPGADAFDRDSMDDVRRTAPNAKIFSVAALGVLEPGLSGVARWTGSVRAARSAPPVPRRLTRASANRDTSADIASLPHAAAIIDTLPPVLIVGGKGGVGKTSVSCALALAMARAGHQTTLVSTDPAPSIADAFEQPVDDVEREVTGGFGLIARQIDATAAFARWREEYQERVDASFDALLGPGLDAVHDRSIARQMLALAPPGIDELYALIWLGDALIEGKVARLIVDPAPTGHLIRLLEMPALALDWSHRLLRLMLKYRELAGGGEIAADLLAFARRTRAVGELLRDVRRAGVLVVSLDEPVVRLEAMRVVSRVRALGDHVPAVIWNRVRQRPVPLPVEPPVRQFVAAATDPPPTGPSRLIRWYDDWRESARDG